MEGPMTMEWALSRPAGSGPAKGRSKRKRAQRTRGKSLDRSTIGVPAGRRLKHRASQSKSPEPQRANPPACFVERKPPVTGCSFFAGEWIKNSQRQICVQLECRPDLAPSGKTSLALPLFGSCGQRMKHLARERTITFHKGIPSKRWLCSPTNGVL